jgi:hypothetical protein
MQPLSKIMAARKTPQPRGPRGFVPQVETAERRAASAAMRSRGAKWQDIADEHWGGDLGLASRQVKQFWAELPRETVEEIRSSMLAKLEGLESDVREVMRRKHYVVAEGRIVIRHRDDCEMILGEGDGRRRLCTCPKLEDDEPIYRGVDHVRKLVETQLKLIPGLAAPKRVEVLDDDAIRAEIDRARADLEAEAEQLAARRIADCAATGDAAGAAGDQGEGGRAPSSA